MRSLMFSLPAIDSGRHGLTFRAKVTNDARQIHFVSDPVCRERLRQSLVGRENGDAAREPLGEMHK